MLGLIMSAVIATATPAIAPPTKSIGIGSPVIVQQTAQDRLTDRDRRIDELHRQLQDCSGSDCDRIRDELRALERMDERDPIRERAHTSDRDGSGPGAGKGGRRGGEHGRGGGRD